MKEYRTYFISSEIALKNISLALTEAVSLLEEGQMRQIDHNAPVKVRALIREDEDSIDEDEEVGIHEGVLESLEITVELIS